MYVYRECCGAGAGAGAVGSLGDAAAVSMLTPSGSGGNPAADFIASLASGVTSVYSTVTGQQAARETYAAQIQLAQIQAEQARERGKVLMVGGGVAALAIVALLVLKRRG